MTKKTEKTVVESKTEETVNLSELLKEFQTVKDELEFLKKVQLSDAEKEAIDDARDEMLIDDEVGSLYIDEKHKEEGYFYRIVDSTRPGRVQSHIRRGYEIVQDPDLVVGQSAVTKASSLTSAVTVELGVNHACLGVLMRIPQEQYDKRQAAKAKHVREITDHMIGEAVNKSDFGEITIGSKTYKK